MRISIPKHPSKTGIDGELLYVLSGVRPSSGVASSTCSNALDFSDTPFALDTAAPEDECAPLNSYELLRSRQTSISFAFARTIQGSRCFPIGKSRPPPVALMCGRYVRMIKVADHRRFTVPPRDGGLPESPPRTPSSSGNSAVHNHFGLMLLLKNRSSIAAGSRDEPHPWR